MKTLFIAALLLSFLILPAYSQDLESDADILGARLVAAGGYDPQAPVRLLSRLAVSSFNIIEQSLSSDMTMSICRLF